MDTGFINELINRVAVIERMTNSFFDIVTVKYSPTPSNIIGFSSYSWIEPNGEVLKIQRELINEYEDWYSQCNHVINKFIPDRRPDFSKMYEENTKIIELEEEIWTNDKDQFKNDFLRNLGKQKSMLVSTISLSKMKEKESRKKTGKIKDTSQNTPISSYVDMNYLIELKAQISILSQQYLRIENDIRNLAQKVDGIGRITINNMNNNVAKTGSIKISIENLNKWVKPDLDKELKELKKELVSKKIDQTDKNTINDLIDDVVKEKKPKIEWLKDKMSKVIYWGTKSGLAMTKIKELINAYGIEIGDLI